MSEYESWGKYHNYEGHITHDMLNKAYGDAGMFFKNRGDAQVHQLKQGGIIYPIKNYAAKEFDIIFLDPDGKKTRYKLRKDAKPYIEGYYVSHPQKAHDSAVIKFPKRMRG